MVMPPGAFITLGLIVGMLNLATRRRSGRAACCGEARS
jgi:Na+-translocating ferredoxin:NAD+ oxidoreductase RnfE subunit